jgi:putative ABC transport system substrate-binding protein
VDALYVCADPPVIANRIRINSLSLGARLPTIYSYREFVEAGGLMSCGAHVPGLLQSSGAADRPMQSAITEEKSMRLRVPLS